MKEENWFNNETLVDVLLFIAPPIGIYAVLKSDKIKFTFFKVLYCVLGITNLMCLLVFCLSQ